MKPKWAMVCALAALATSGFAQVLRYPPNAQAGNCLAEPGRSWVDVFTTTTVEPDGTGAVRASFTLTNQCATRVSVSGLEPPTALGASIIADAAIEVVLISTASDDAETGYLQSGMGSLGVFDVPPHATVTQHVVIRPTFGTDADAVAASVYSYSGNGGHAWVGGEINVVVTGIGARTVCVHYADRPCGTYQ